MSDGVTGPAEAGPQERPDPADDLRPGLVQAVIAVAVFAVVGAVAGAVWNWLWDPATGVVVDHKWVPADAIELQQQFSSTGWYVLVGSVAGLLAGVVVALLLDRVPLLTLVAVVLGSVLGAWVMLLVGSALGPADPQVLARTAAEGTRLPEDLGISGRSPWIAFPAGALIGVALAFLGLSGRRTPRQASEDEPVTSG